MRSLNWILICTVVTFANLSTGAELDKVPDPSSPEFPAYVMERVDDQYREGKSHGVMVMTVKTKHWTRSMTMEAWSLGQDYSLVKILQPKKEKGNATLKARNDLFTYLNKTGRTVKITSGMMGGSWMGSHFTNDDLVRHTRLSKHYKIKLAFRGPSEGGAIYRFELIPNPDAPVVWGKLVVTVKQEGLLPISQEFFDEEGAKVRVLTFSDYQKVGGKMRPMKMTMKPLDKPEEFTMVQWKEIDFSVKLDKSFFTIQKLKSR